MSPKKPNQYTVYVYCKCMTVNRAKGLQLRVLKLRGDTGFRPIVQLIFSCYFTQNRRGTKSYSVRGAQSEASASGVSWVLWKAEIG